MADDEEVDQENPPRTLRGTRAFLIEFLGWKPELLEFFRPTGRAHMFASPVTGNDSEPADDRPDPRQSAV